MYAFIDIVEETKETAPVTDEDEEEKPMVIVDFATEDISSFVTENDTDKQAPVGNISQNNRVQNKQRQSTFLWTHNTRLRYILYKEIKKPGRSKSVICFRIKFCIRESMNVYNKYIKNQYLFLALPGMLALPCPALPCPVYCIGFCFVFLACIEGFVIVIFC